MAAKRRRNLKGFRETEKMDCRKKAQKSQRGLEKQKKVMAAPVKYVALSLTCPG